MRNSLWRWSLPLLILICAGWLLLPNLGRHHLWQDEAQTALISQTVLEYGMPRCSDERNSFSQELGAECDPSGIYKWHPWLPFYTHALAFEFIGKSDWASRFPDVVFGIGTILLCFWTMQSAGRGSRCAFLAAVSLLFMIPFLLLSRQCRYYSMVSFFSMACLWSYFESLKSKKIAPFLLSIFSILLFHTQIIYCFVFWIAAILHALLFEQKKMKNLILPIFITGLGTLPWLYYVREISYLSQYQQTFSWQSGFKKAYSLISQIGTHIVPLSFFPFGLLVFLWRKKYPVQFQKDRNSLIYFLLLYLFITIATLALIAPAAFFRYLSATLPVCALLMAEIINYGFCASSILGGMGLFLLLVNQPVPDYLHELTHDFRGPVEGLVDYIKPRIRSTNDLIVVTYEDMPLKWYLKVRVLGGLTGEKLDDSKHARWVVLRKQTISEKDRGVMEYLLKNVPWDQYRKIALNAPDTLFENRESPKLHLYRTAEYEDPVIIFERIER